MKRLVSILCLAMVLFGCGPAVTEPEPIQQLELRLALPADADGITLQTAETFAKRVSEVSKGQMAIKLIQAAQPANALTGGSCGMALLPSGQIAERVPALGIVAQPFFWKDYTHFTTALNRPENLELASLLIEPELDAEVLGVYYAGSVTLLARKRIYDELALENLSIALTHDSASFDCFTALKARVQQMPRQEVVSTFMRGEVSLIEGSVADLASLVTGQNTVYVLPLDHYLLGEWLLLDKELAKTLTAQQKAVLADALAVSMEQNDRTRQEWATQTIEERRVDNVLLHEGTFTITFTAGNRYLFEQVVPNSGWNDKLIEAYLMGNKPGRY